MKAGKEPNLDELFTDWSNLDYVKTGSELFAVLTSLTAGEAMTVVRGVSNGNGWEALSGLVNCFDPKTAAKASCP